MPSFPKSLLALSLFALAACDRTDGPRSNTAPVTCVLRLVDGSPASNATVRIYPVDHIPGDAAAKASADGVAFSTRTDAQGRYTVDSLPAGEYNILGQKDDLQSYQDSVYLSATPKDLDTGVLLTAGTIVGRVALQPNHSLETATVQALGTNAYANADANGRFELGPLAEGRYRLRIVTTEAQYTPLFASVQVSAGRAETLPGILSPAFTGIPVVTGLSATYDTLKGVVTLKWDKTRYPQFLEYQIYRNAASELVPSLIPIAKTKDTSYADTVYLDGTFAGAADVGRPILQYRVRVVSRSDIAGLAFDRLEISAPPPQSVRATLALDAQDARTQTSLPDGVASPRDSLRINAAYRDSGRALVRMRWYHGSAKAPFEVRDIKPPARSGAMAIGWMTGGVGMDTLRAEAEDEAGDLWSQILVIPIVQDAPIAAAGADTLVPRNGTAYLNGKGTDRHGRIVKWEWDIGATGHFIRTSGADTDFVAPPDFDRFPCVLRITDDDGNVAESRKTVTVHLEWRPEKVSFPGWDNGVQDHAMEAFNGKLWLLGGETVKGVAAGPNSGILAESEDGFTWNRLHPATLFSGRSKAGSLVHGGKLWVFGGLGASNGYGQVLLSDVWSSVDGLNWSEASGDAFPAENTGFSVVSFQGKMWCIQGRSLHSDGALVWSSVDGVTWERTVPAKPLPQLNGQSALVHDGKILVIGEIPDPVSAGTWSSSNGIDWEKIGQNPAFGAIISGKAVDYGGWIWMIGGYRDGIGSYYGGANTQAWYSKDGISWQASQRGDGRAGMRGTAVVFKDELWTHFGDDSTGNLTDAIWHAH